MLGGWMVDGKRSVDGFNKKKGNLRRIASLRERACNEYPP
jgi:hypothetical protein